MQPVKPYHRIEARIDLSAIRKNITTVQALNPPDRKTLLVIKADAYGHGAVTLAGEGAMLAADVFFGVSACLIKIFSRDENPVTLSGYQFALGGVVLLGLGAALGGELHFYSPACAMNLLYMGFISAGAYTLWGVLLKYNPVSRISILGFMNPVMGVLLSALFLNEGREAFSLSGLFALLLVSAGIIIVNTADRHSGRKA